MSYAFYLPGPLVVLAVLLDVLWGDPRWFPHPVRLIGRTITAGEALLHTGDQIGDLAGGAALVISVVALSMAAIWALVSVAAAISSPLGAQSAQRKGE